MAAKFNDHARQAYNLLLPDTVHALLAILVGHIAASVDFVHDELACGGSVLERKAELLGHGNDDLSWSGLNNSSSRGRIPPAKFRDGDQVGR